VKIVATRCCIEYQKANAPNLISDTTGGAYSAPQDPLPVNRGGLFVTEMTGGIDEGRDISVRKGKRDGTYL